METLERSGINSAILTQKKTALGKLLPCAARFLCAFLFSGASLGADYLPLGLCFVAAAGPGLYGSCSLFGLCLGTVLLRKGMEAAEILICAVLVYAVAWVFRTSALEENRFFMPFAAAAVMAATGGAMLLAGSGGVRGVLLLLLRVAFCAAGTLVLQHVLSGLHRQDLLFLGSCLVISAAPIRLCGYSVGILLAAALTALCAGSTQGMLCAAVCGASLDLIGASSAPMTALLCLLSLASGALRRQYRLLPAAAGLAILLGGSLLTARPWASVFIPAALGAIPMLLLPQRREPRRRCDRPQPQIARIEEAARLLDRLGADLSGTLPEPPQPEPSEIFDRASDRVCRTCPSFAACWGAEGEAYEAFSGAAGPMLARGAALPDDFPVPFLAKCRRIEALLAAINQELDALLCRRQFRSRLTESRRMLAGQYRVFAAYLGGAAAELRGVQTAHAVCVPIVGTATEGRRGSSVSGDRGAVFRVGRHDHYILLCDGMGSGEEAMRESGGCAELLRGLLSAGFSPDAALRLLNSVYLLRDDGAFSTVDLLRTDLSTGRTELYKWGSAPSYLKTPSGVRKIGTALPPPGLEGTGRAERTELSLGTGEMLILLSDGADTPILQERIRRYRGNSPRELAAEIVQQGEDDDRTAVVLRLQSVAPRRQNTTPCA